MQLFKKNNPDLKFGRFIILLAVVFFGAQFALAGNSGNCSGHAWAEKFGYISVSGEGASVDYGVTVGNAALTGYAWSELTGWINFNDAGSNYGVLNDGAGNLTGYAWSEKFGYISFSDSSAGNYYQTTIGADGSLSGYAWSELGGYINMDDADTYYVASTTWSSPYDLRIEQQINIINQEYNNGTDSYLPADNSLGLVTWEPDNFSDESVYFEAVLYDGTDWDRTRNATNLTTALASGMNYSIRIKLDGGICYASLFDQFGAQVSESELGRTSATACSIKAARLIVHQLAESMITDSTGYVELGVATSTAQTATTTLSDPKYYTYDADLFSPDPTAYFEATLKSAAYVPQIASTVTSIANGTDFYMDMPVNAPAGDLYVAVFGKDDDEVFTFIPPNWNIIYDLSSDSAGVRHAAYWWIATSTGEPTQYLVQGDSEEWSGAIIQITGFDPDDPVNGSSTAFAVSGRPTSPDLTPTIMNTLVLRTATIDIDEFGPGYEPPGTDGVFYRNSSTGNGAGNTAAASSTGSLDPVGTAAFQDSGEALDDNYVAGTFAVNPDPGNPGTAYAALYVVGGSEVTGSQVAVASTSYDIARSGSVTLSDDTEYEVRLTALDNNFAYLAGAKLVLVQTAPDGIGATEIVHHYVNAATSTGASWATTSFPNLYNADYFLGGTTTRVFQTVFQNNGGTASARLGPSSIGSVIYNTAGYVSTTSAPITLADDIEYDTQGQNARISSSWLLHRISGLKPATLASAADQTFCLNGSPTVISPITITANADDQITTGDDIRITIATTTANMRWDISSTTAAITGSASGKVDSGVSYTNGNATLIIDVTSPFNSGDEITVAWLLFKDFLSENNAKPALRLYTGGASDTTAEDTDDSTIAIASCIKYRFQPGAGAIKFEGKVKFE